MANFEKLKNLANLQKSLASVSSTTRKKEILEEYKNESDQNFNKRVFGFLFDNTINFHVTSERLKGVISFGGNDFDFFETDDDILDFFDKLSKKVGADMNTLVLCKNLHKYLLSVDGDVAELFLNIMDKDFKCGVNLKTILSVFPDVVYEFNVALANKYFGNEKKVNFDDGTWWASRKMDGCRCLAVVSFDGEKHTCVTWSRQGKRFETLSKLEREIEDFCAKNNIKNVVFDGECCIVDENGDEHFDWIMKEIKRKNHTIEHPMYQVFDILTTNEFFVGIGSPDFVDRQKMLDNVFSLGEFKYMKKVKQTNIENKEMFNTLYKNAIEKGWEGLIIRKNVPYEGKRTNNMLKCKSFNDAEYEVVGYHTADMRFVENGSQVTRNVLSDVTIIHKGNEVSVGSGFSKEQRIKYKENPELIVGKTITVQYFEESKDKDGNLSLRFPTVKQVYENGRDI